MEEGATYKSIVKATGLLGGVQVINIIVSVLKTKVVAILLGPEGVGVISLLSSTVDLIRNVGTLGLTQSGVRDVAVSYATNDKIQIGRTVKVVKSWILVTGIIGTLLMILFSNLLSKITFGNELYTSAFIFLSVVILFSAVSSAQNVILQGCRQLRFLALSTLLASIIGLAASIPLYYFLGVKGIVPSIILLSLFSLVISFYYSKKMDISKVYLSWKETYKIGCSMLRLGLSMLLSSYITIVASYVIRAYIVRDGGLDEVGLFQAAFSIVEVYFGMVFTAMGTDYYPRLAGASDNNLQITKEVNKQAEISLLLIMPLLSIFIFMSPLLVTILYSKDFTLIASYLVYASLGVFFKAFSFSLGYVLFAKSKNKIFIFTALTFNTLFLINNIIGYNWGGLTGLGISYSVNYLIHLVVLFIIMQRVICYKICKEVWTIFIVGGGMTVLCVLSERIIENTILYLLVGIFLVSLSVAFSLYELNQRIKILNYVQSFVRKNKK